MLKDETATLNELSILEKKGKKGKARAKRDKD